MTEQEIERCLERFTIGKATDVMNFDYAGTLAYIQRLKAENAELRARLENAVGLPYMYEAELVDSAGHFFKTIYIVLHNNNGTIRAVQYSYKKVAEARLKELQGGER